MAKSLTASDGKNITCLGAETEFEGELTFTDNLTIEGKFSGTIAAEGNLEIAANASCLVDTITTETVVISGAVAGDISASSRVEMKSGSKITGNITTARLRIEDGVDFSGTVTMLNTEEDTPDIFAVTAAEYKEMIARETAETAATAGDGEY